MSDDSDVMVSDVMIIVDPKFDGKLSDFVKQLKALGMRVDNINDDQDMIEGTIESAKLGQVRKLDGVDALRTVFTYVDRPSEKAS